MKKISCEDCCDAMISADKSNSHLSLISIKDNGDLVYPSEEIVTIVVTCDKFFKRYVREKLNGINASRYLEPQLTNTIVNELSITRPGKILFSGLLEHDIESHLLTEDYHSTQIMEAVISKYGQEYTSNVIMAHNVGKRQQLNNYGF